MRPLSSVSTSSPVGSTPQVATQSTCNPVCPPLVGAGVHLLDLHSAPKNGTTAPQRTHHAMREASILFRGEVRWQSACHLGHFSDRHFRSGAISGAQLADTQPLCVGKTKQRVDLDSFEC